MSTVVTDLAAGTGAAPAHGHEASNALIKPGYDPRLTNEDLAPLKRQSWGQYNILGLNENTPHETRLLIR